MTQHVVVVGAGIVGVSTAIWLRRVGVRVTLVDRAAPGEGTSHGNAGVLASAAVVPVTTPGLIPKAPRMMLSPDFPLFLRWSYLPKLLPWLIRYLGHANDADTRRITQGIAGVTADSVPQHQSLVRDLGLEHWVTTSDYAFAYKDRAAFDAESYVWRLRREAGFTPLLIEGRDIKDYEPSFGADIGLIATLSGHGFIRDPGGYVKALAAAFENMGGVIRQSEVKDFDLSGETVAGVETSTGRIDCTDVVITTGVWSKPLMKKLGLTVPLESERGYHIVFEDAENGPCRPTMISSGKFVATPMAQGLRCAGIVELGGLHAGPSQAPFSLLRRQVGKVFPNLTARSEVEWMGHRPAPSDSLPLIGQVGSTRVFTGFGHHHIGLTAGPKTGRLITGLVTNQPPNMDLSPYDPQRFNG